MKCENCKNFKKTSFGAKCIKSILPKHFTNGFQMITQSKLCGQK